MIEELSLVFAPGMTAVTGETGAGKTLVVTAIELLVGGKAETSMVRPGADEAVVEGRFDLGDRDCIVRRVLPAKGRSRGYIDGSLATIAELSEVGSRLVDLHGQHDHQSLLTSSVQRQALDRFGGVDLQPLRVARQRVIDLEAQRSSLGGDPRDRAREIDLLRFQVEELVAAALDDPNEDANLRSQAELLADAGGYREAAILALDALSSDGGATDAIGRAVAGLGDRTLFAAVVVRLRDAQAEIDDLARELRSTAEGIESDPENLAHRPDLALPKARLEVEVAGVAGRDVTFRFAANPGMELQPLAKVASGGELARAMLALRLVLTEGPPVLVFDEVDAGIGGAAAVAVGRSLAALGSDHQVLVVTHLAQVASWADAHVVVDKVATDSTTTTKISVVNGEERVTELARMLSGTPESSTAQQHARELLESTQS